MSKNKKTKTMKIRSKRSKSRRGRSRSRRRVAGSTHVAKGCAGVEKGIRVDQKRIDLSGWRPYFPGTGVYRGEVDCGNKEVTGKGRASGTGTWESDNVLHGQEESFLNPGSKRSGTIVSGKWLNNMPYDVTVTTPNGTHKYKKESQDTVEQHMRDSMSSRASTVSDRSSMVSDRSSLSTVDLDSEDDFRDSVFSRPSIVRGSWHAKKTGGRIRKNRKTRRNKRKH